MTPRGNVINFRPWRWRHSQRVIGALDIGHSKIAYLLAAPSRHPANPPTLLGFGEVAVQKACWQEPDYFKDAVAMAMRAAERMAGLQAARIAVASSAFATTCEPRAGHIMVNGVIDDEAYRRVLDNNYQRFDDDAQAVLHALVLSCSVDEQASLRDPRGLRAEQLRMAMLGIRVQKFHLRLLEALLVQTHMDVEKYVVPAYANALAVATPENFDSGFLAMDIGAQRTSFALHSRGGVIHVGDIPVGGWHISNDIAQICSLPFMVAERAKQLFGNALGQLPDSAMRYEHLLPGEADDVPEVSTYMIDCVKISEVIRPRVEEILDMVQSHLEAQGLASARYKQIVLCGGTAQLAGLSDLVRMHWRKKAVLAPKALVAGQYQLSTRHSVNLGLLRYLCQMDAAILPQQTLRAMQGRSRLWAETLNTEKLKNAFYKFDESLNP